MARVARDVAQKDQIKGVLSMRDWPQDLWGYMKGYA